MGNARKTAAVALTRVDENNAYSNIVLSDVLKKAELSKEDTALASALFYGTLDRKITVDYYLSKFIKTPLKKIPPFSLAVLRSAVYQIKYMTRIPQSAAVNEAVKLVKNSKENRMSGLTNAVLRNIIRNDIKLPDGCGLNSLSVRYSCPEWIVKSFIDDYGADTAESLLAESLETPPVTFRVNTLKTTAEELKDELEKNGIAADFGKTENSLVIKGGTDITKLNAYKKGLFHVQDEASQRAIAVLAPKSGERMLDMCAAPGGKSFTAAQLMQNRGEIVACDIYEGRVGLITEGAERLGIDIIKPCVRDAETNYPKLGLYDCVLCDVPCSGLGVLRRKPDIKYKSCEDFSSLKKIQRTILKNALTYLKPGGRLLYSTCTLRTDENEKLVNSVIMEYNGIKKTYEHTYMPHIDKTDGFYCALILKEGNAPLD